MIPTARLMTMVGPTHGADRFGFGRGGGTYRRRLERDFGMNVDPFHRAIHRFGVIHRLGRGCSADVPVTTSDRSVHGARAGMRWSSRLLRTGQVAIVLLLVVVLGACSGASGKASGSGAGEGAKAGGAGSPPLLERTPSQFQADLASL